MQFHSRIAERTALTLLAAGLVVGSAVPAAFGQSAATNTNSTGTTTPAAPVVSTVVENSVVKIFATVRYPDLFKPWNKQAPVEATGSGVVIDGKRILSNAHVVLYASQVQVQANQAGDKISATVEAIAPGIDLAVLRIDDPAFFAAHPPLPRAKVLPEIKDSVMVYGYPRGGNTLSITKGIVSRTEFDRYNYPVSGLRIQIDAAINPGNSGGPAVAGDKMIGLAFSRLNEAENIGYIIPCEEIDLFLDDVADGKYDGKPAMFDELQTLENSALRTFLKLDKSVEGIIVHRPDSSAPDYPLKEWDVISRIGDTPVDDQGMIKVGANLRLNFNYLVQKVAKNGRVPLTVVRGGKELKVELPVSSKRPQVLPDLGTAYPSYFIYGPMVFTTATMQFVSSLTRTGSDTWSGLLSAIASPLIRRSGDKPAFEGEELVVVPSPFFPHKLSQGYSEPYGQVVKSINGRPIKNLRHLVEVLRDLNDEFVTIAFEGRYGETLIFPRKDMLAATDEILTDSGIRSQGSPDTLSVWNAKPAK